MQCKQHNRIKRRMRCGRRGVKMKGRLYVERVVGKGKGRQRMTIKEVTWDDKGKGYIVA